jgi:hypothetical protein
MSLGTLTFNDPGGGLAFPDNGTVCGHSASRGGLAHHRLTPARDRGACRAAGSRRMPRAMSVQVFTSVAGVVASGAAEDARRGMAMLEGSCLCGGVACEADAPPGPITFF